MNASTGSRLTVAAEHLRQRRLSAAAGVFREILAEDPNHVEALNGLAIEALMRGSGEAALPLLARAAAIDPNDAATFANLGQAHLLSGRVEDAETCLDMALHLAPEHVDAGISRAMLRWRKGEAVAALDALRELMQRHPSHAPLRCAVGTLHAERQEPAKATEAFREAVSLDPTLTDAWRSLGLLEAAGGRLDSATACLRRAYELAPTSSACLLALGDLLVRTGCAEEAERLARRGIALAPLSPEPLVLHGRALLALKRADEGMKVLAKASSAAPSSPLPFFALAEGFLADGDIDQAEACAEEAARLATDQPLLRQAAIVLLLRSARWQAAWRAMAAKLLPDPPPLGEIVTLAAPSSVADTLFFARLCPLAAEAGGGVRLSGPTPLRGLLGGVPGLIVEDPTALERAIGDLSLLGPILKPEPEDAPPLKLNVPQQRVEAWRQEFQNRPRPIIAIAWDEGSDLTLPKLLPALPPGATCVSLVTSRRRVALEAYPEAIDAGARLRDYDDLAALLMAVDAVMLPDGPAAHLAGALGASGVIATAVGHFVWGAAEAPSAWYPTLRVTRKFASEELGRLLREALA